MYFLATTMNHYMEIKSQVEAKWDIIAMLCLLLFFLTVVVVVFSIWRPYFLVHKILALLVGFLLGYGVSQLAVHKGLSKEFYKAACHEFKVRRGQSQPNAEAQCRKNNPIRLSRLPRE